MKASVLKDYKNKLFQIGEDGSTFVILASDYDHHKGYTEFLLKFIDYKEDFMDIGYITYGMKPSRVWIKGNMLMGRDLRIISQGASVSVLYGEKE